MDVAKRKVLIVEDRFILYDQIKDFFKKEGYEIIGHDDGRAVDNYEDAVQLLKNDKPHIAVLDIELKGKKDGLELAAYIKEHFYTFILILTDYDNSENKKRADRIDTDEFYFKMKKADMMRNFKNFIDTQSSKFIDGIKTEGGFFKVKEVDVKKQTVKKDRDRINNYDPLGIETYVKWEAITFIESYNHEARNNIIMHNINGETDYVVRITLDELENQWLPYHFIRFSDSQIVNFNQITSRIARGQTVYFIGENTCKLNDGYKEAALAKINLLSGKRK